VAPALIAGNCAILKPSEFACLSCMFLAQLAQDAGIPAGEFRSIRHAPLSVLRLLRR